MHEGERRQFQSLLERHVSEAIYCGREMREERLHLASAEYLLLSAPHGNDGVLLRQRKDHSPQSHIVHRDFICCAHRSLPMGTT